MDGALGNTVSGVCESGLDRSRTLMHSSHAGSIAELGSSYHATNKALLWGVNSKKLGKGD